MKNYKRFATVAVATAMVAGNVFAAMAASEGSASGTGEYEGYVEKTSVFKVDVPTAAANTFNFFIDPNGLLAGTDYARIGSGVTEADFETGATLFFTRTPKAVEGETPAVVTYGKDSEAVTLKNLSSYEVDVEVAATVTGADKITLGEVKDDTSDPTIELAIVSGDDDAAITADGGKLTGTIAGADSNFEIKWDGQKYVYAEIATPDVDAWQTYSFNLTGACGGTWTADQADVTPIVTLTWKVTDPKATPTSATTAATSITAGGEAVEITIPDGITVVSVEKTKADGTYNALPAEHYTWQDVDGGKKLTVKASFMTNFGAGKKIKITFSAGDPIELDVQK